MKLSDKIADGIGIDASYVEIIATRNNLYRKYYVEKKSGGKREILHPSKELKVIQRWLLKNILIKFPVSQYSYAYSKGDSIKKNALKHCQSNYLLHMDITNFFPSIKREMLVKYFEQNQKIVNELGLSEKDLKLILDICLYNGEYLVIGSVASPRIANMIMYEFDTELKRQLEDMGQFYYTRYADDIIVSSKSYIDKKVIEVVSDLMMRKGFAMNPKKTYFMNKKGKRQVTGVVIDNNKNALTVGNTRYKMFERELYRYLVKGEGDGGHIKGYLSYIKGLNMQQYNQLKYIYSKYDLNNKVF